MFIGMAVQSIVMASVNFFPEADKALEPGKLVILCLVYVFIAVFALYIEKNSRKDSFEES